MELIVVIAALLRLLFTLWVVIGCPRRIGRPRGPMTWREYGIACFLSVLNVILVGRALGLW